jgi:hypothetical protein
VTEQRQVGEGGIRIHIEETLVPSPRLARSEVAVVNEDQTIPSPKNLEVTMARLTFSNRMDAGRLILFAGLASLSALGGTATARAQSPDSSSHSGHVMDRAASSKSDSAFAAVQARGADRRGMGVDQSTSLHQFDALPDGGRIELQRAVDDTAGVTAIRHHLREIASAFTEGDFHTPAFVHMQQVPGTAIMAAKRGVITYIVRDLPRGGEVRITTHDPEALAAVHEFIAFQRTDHRAGGVGSPQHTQGDSHGEHSHPQ